MKSKVGLKKLRSNGEGRSSQALPGGATLQGASDKTASVPDPSNLVAVVVHVEKNALDVLMEKGGG